MCQALLALTVNTILTYRIKEELRSRKITEEDIGGSFGAATLAFFFLQQQTL